MSSKATVARWTVLTALLVSTTSLVAEDDALPLRTPAETPPEILEHLAAHQEVFAFALHPDGRQAAVAVADGSKGTRSRIELVSADNPEPQIVVTQGRVRALLYNLDGSTLWGVLHRPASKRQPGTTFLFQVDPRKPRLRRENLLPTSTRDMDYWPQRNMLLFAAENELRSLELPTLRSGPLYRLPGANLSVAAVGRASQVLIGRTDELILVDLSDRPGPEEWPVREHLATDGAIVELAVSSDRQRALARSADGQLYEVDFPRLKLTDAGRGWAIDAPPAAMTLVAAAEPERPEDVTPLVFQTEPEDPVVATATVAAPEEQSDTAAEDDATAASTPEGPTEARAESDRPDAAAAAATPAAAAGFARPSSDKPSAKSASTKSERPTQDEPQPTGAAGAVAASAREQTESEGATPESVTPETKSTAAPTDAAPAATAVDDAQATAAPAKTRHAPPVVRGKLVGDAVSEVAWVVLLGPNNIVREATRVKPDPDGHWEVGLLAPGVYRIQVDGGGRKVLVSDPPFLTLTIEPGTSVDAPDWRIVGSL